MKKRPFLYIGLASFLAVLTCSLTTPTVGIPIVSVTALLVFACSLCRRVPLAPKITALVGISAILCAVLFAARIHYVVQPQLELAGTTATVTVRVEGELSSSNGYIVRVEDGELQKGLRLCFWAGYRQISPKSGDLLTATLHLVAAYDEESESGHTAKANGIFLYAWPTQDSELDWEDGQDGLRWYERLVGMIRDRIHDTLYRRMSYEGAAFSEGMMFGNSANIPYETGAAFRISGVYHLLAVSGSHLVLITAVIYRIMGSLHASRRMRALLTMAAILLFTALCGFAASVVRAGITTSVMLCGQIFRRRPDGLNSLGFAAVIMLIADPFCMYDIGWQLSFAATLGLLLFVPVWHKEINGRIASATPSAAVWLVPVSTAVGVTVCASLATMPLTALHFGGISTVFLFGNLVCVPLSEALLMGSFLSVLTAWFAPLSEPLFWVCEQLGRWMTEYAQLLASMPFSSVITEPWVVCWLFVLIVALVIGYGVRGMRGSLFAALLMIAVLAVGSGISAVVYRGTWRIAVAPADEIAVTVHTAQSDGVIVSASGDALKEAGLLLRDTGVSSPDWMLWLGEPSQQTVDLSQAPQTVGTILTQAPSDTYVSLPDADAYITLESGMGIDADAALIERHKDVWRLTLGDTVILIVPYEDTDLTDLPSAWCETDILLLQAMPFGVERIRAGQTIVCCGHGDTEQFREILPDAVYAVEGGTLQFRTGSTLRE